MIRAHDESMLELAALRAIDALEADEAAIIDQHMAECAACREEFARARAAGTAFAFAVSAPPPASLRARVLSTAVKVRRLRPWYGQSAVRAGAVAAAVLIAVGTWMFAHQTAPTLHGIATCTLSGLDCGTVVASGGVLQVEAHGLPTPPAGKVYQAWVIHPKRKPIPEQTLTVSQSGEGSIEIAAAADKGDIIALTVEPAGGSRAPTSKPVWVATLD